MAKVVEHLKGVNAYPIPLRTFVEIAEKRGLDLDREATSVDLSSAEYELAKADLLTWLSFAPDISQGGQTFAFTDKQRKEFRISANTIYKQFDPEGTTYQKPVKYGYKGSRL